jgi:hypothetical protein
MVASALAHPTSMLVGLDASAVDIYAAELTGTLQRMAFTPSGNKGRLEFVKDTFGALATSDEVKVLRDKNIDAHAGAKQEILENLNNLFLRFVESSFQKLGMDVPKKIIKSIENGSRVGFTVIETRMIELIKAAKALAPSNPLIARLTLAITLRLFRNGLQDSSSGL